MKRFKKLLLAALALLVTVSLLRLKTDEVQADQAQGDQRQANQVQTDQTFDTLEIHFMDVGQGDSTLIKCGPEVMLIDAGDDSRGTQIQSYLKNKNIDRIDYLVLTHPDSDHIGGAPVVITKFDIGKVFMSNFEKDNRTYQKLIQSLDHKRLKYTTPDQGNTISLGTARITFLSSPAQYEDPNNSSIALLIENGDNRFLFTGDAEETAESDIIRENGDIRADVYKAGHHGSKTSSSEEFLEAVSPDYAVISCGEENSYGHPHAQTLNSFRSSNVKVYRTDEQGTIIAKSDGKNITFDVPPSQTWKPGEPTGGSSGTSKKEEDPYSETEKDAGKEVTYVLNTKSKKFHETTCGSLPETNRKDTGESRDTIISNGYSPCKICNP